MCTCYQHMACQFAPDRVAAAAALAIVQVTPVAPHHCSAGVCWITQIAFALDNRTGAVFAYNGSFVPLHNIIEHHFGLGFYRASRPRRAANRTLRQNFAWSTFRAYPAHGVIAPEGDWIVEHLVADIALEFVSQRDWRC